MRWGLDRQTRKARLRKGRGALPALCPFGDIFASVANLCLSRHATTERIDRRPTPRAHRDGTHDDRRNGQRT